MQISSRFTIAIQIFACVDVFKETHKVTSEFLASSINVNPVIVRKIMIQLKNTGLLNVARGTGGTSAARPLEEITFYDVYEAVDLIENGDLFHFHENPCSDCPVGKNIRYALDDRLQSVQTAMENELRRFTIADVVGDIRQRMELEKQ